jgi:vacuolar-type H+-ATPase subunit I/STV1
MSASTRFLARLFGTYCLIMAFAMALNRDAMVNTVAALAQDAPVMFVLGVFTLFGGLAMLLVHNRWKGDGYAVVVTLLGWITLLKGLLIVLIAPRNATGLYLEYMHYAKMFYVCAAWSAVIGAYLCYGGFVARGPINTIAGRPR